MGKIIENNFVVEIHKVKPNDFNPKPDYTSSEELKVEFEKIKSSLRVHGQADPIQVREVDGEIPYEIVNGYHRWLAMQELGFDKIEVKNLGKISREEAIKKALSFEELRIPLDVLEVAKLVKHLSETEIGMEGLQYLEQEIQDKLALLKFDFSQFEKEPIEPIDLPIVFSFTCTSEQAKIIRQAIEKLRNQTETDASEGRALELICADFLAGK